jgi:ribonuclease P/MRP protein subunit POP1
MAELPTEFQVGQFLKGRVKELSGLAYVVSSDIKHGKLASQQVPRHMRRRAVSHDVRRLPRRLREKYIKEKNQGGGNVAASKRPSRRHRRRPGNLLKEYNRRQMKNFWLETHIWHAKRFHILEKWGHKIPGYPNDKCWRACYRGAKSSALIFDVSYLNLIQIKGKSDVLLKSLKSISRDWTGMEFKAPSVSGEQIAFVFSSSDQVIGEVSYFWLSSAKVEEGSADDATIWIFSHPAFVSQVMTELKSAFEVQDDYLKSSAEDLKSSEDNPKSSAEDFKSDADEPTEPAAKRIKLDKENSKTDVIASENLKTKEPAPAKNVNAEKISPRNVPACRAPTYFGAHGIKIIDFQGTMNRFRLVGPKSADILRSVCVSANVEPSLPPIEKAGLTWWKEFYSNPDNLAGFKSQESAMERLGEKPGYQGNISLTVRDPRLLLPVKKYPPPKPISNTTTTTTYDKSGTKKSAVLVDIAPVPAPAPSTPAASETAPVPASTPPLSSSNLRWLDSPFFSASIRDSVTLSKSPDAKINKARSDLLIPGSGLNLGEAESRVPVLIIEQDTGYDLLVPAGWGMSFWQCLVFNGCRAAGDRELAQHSIEQGVAPLLHRYPDSRAGQSELELNAESAKSKHFALPPNKRVNFAKLGIASPFQPPWAVLLKDWRSDNSLCGPVPLPEVVHVLREAELLRRLREDKLSGEDVEKFGDYLVGVRLRIQGKGKLGENSLICHPSTQDLEVDGFEGPMERVHEDDMEKERKETREMHQLTKKRLKRQWKKLKDKEVLMKTQSTALGKPLDEEKLNLVTSNMNTVKKIREQRNHEFGAKNEELWIGDFNTVRHSSKREIFGFITAANMSYTIGGYLGFGYVSLRGLLKWKELKNPKSLALTREVSSTQYRFSSLAIL